MQNWKHFYLAFISHGIFCSKMLLANASLEKTGKNGKNWIKVPLQNGKRVTVQSRFRPFWLGPKSHHFLWTLTTHDHLASACVSCLDRKFLLTLGRNTSDTGWTQPRQVVLSRQIVGISSFFPANPWVLLSGGGGWCHLWASNWRSRAMAGVNQFWQSIVPAPHKRLSVRVLAKWTHEHSVLFFPIVQHILSSETNFRCLQRSWSGHWSRHRPWALDRHVYRLGTVRAVLSVRARVYL